MIDKCILFSPMIFIDYHYTDTNNISDTYLSPDNVNLCKKIIFETEDHNQYKPLEYEWEKFPPMYISVSDDEILLLDSMFIFEHIKNGHITIYKKLFHSFILFWNYLEEESKIEFEQIRNFLRKF